MLVWPLYQLHHLYGLNYLENICCVWSLCSSLKRLAVDRPDALTRDASLWSLMFIFVSSVCALVISARFFSSFFNSASRDYMQSCLSYSALVVWWWHLEHLTDTARQSRFRCYFRRSSVWNLRPHSSGHAAWLGWQVLWWVSAPVYLKAVLQTEHENSISFSSAITLRLTFFERRGSLQLGQDYLLLAHFVRQAEQKMQSHFGHSTGDITTSLQIRQQKKSSKGCATAIWVVRIPVYGDNCGTVTRAISSDTYPASGAKAKLGSTI